MCIVGAQRISLTKVLTLLCKTRKWCLDMATEHITGLKYFKIWKLWWNHTLNNMLMCLAQAIHIELMTVTALRTLPISGLSSRLTRTRNGFRYAWWRSSTSASENFWCSISARPCFVLFLKPQIRILYTAQFDITGCSTCKNSGIERKPVMRHGRSTEKVSPPWIQDMPHVCSEVLPIIHRGIMTRNVLDRDLLCRKAPLPQLKDPWNIFQKNTRTGLRKNLRARILARWCSL